MNKYFPFPLRYSIPFILIFCGSLLGIFSLSQEVRQRYQDTEINMQNYVQVLAGQTSVILDYLYRRKNIEDAVITIISQLGSDPNLNLVIVVDENNKIIESNCYELRKVMVKKTVTSDYINKFDVVRKTLSGQVFLSKDNSKIIAIYPILLEVLPHEIISSRIGILFFEYDLTKLKKQSFENALRKSIIFTIILTISCFLLWVFFEITLTRRVSLLVSASNDLAEGNLDVRANLTGSDELKDISVAFDSMGDKIQKNTNKLEYELMQRKIITEKLKETNKKLVYATETKSQFLANMSHEIRTPINGVIGITELLNMTNLTEEQKDLVNIIQDSSGTLLTIINDILDFSKNESGNLQLEESPFIFSDLLKSVCNLLQQKILTKNIKLEYSIDSDIPDNFMGDASRLRQIFFNLIGNAIKFTDKGSIFISVKSKKNFNKKAKKYELIISIQDTGIGIKKNCIHELFNPFTQGDISISRKYGGTGLGLAISKNLINLMGGQIWVETQGNIGGNPPKNWVAKSSSIQGSIFYFTISLETIIDSEISEKVSTKILIKNPLSKTVKIKILLAEDNKVNQKVALLMLNKLGYHAEIANNGLEVLDKLEKQFYEVIFMDIQMPEMDGITTTKIIRQSSKLQPYIIALTANALPEDKEICLSAGMNDYLSKPIAIKEINRVLSNI